MREREGIVVNGDLKENPSETLFESDFSPLSDS
jgi:hypothetical protein